MGIGTLGYLRSNFNPVPHTQEFATRITLAETTTQFPQLIFGHSGIHRPSIRKHSHELRDITLALPDECHATFGNLLADIGCKLDLRKGNSRHPCRFKCTLYSFRNDYRNRPSL